MARFLKPFFKKLMNSSWIQAFLSRMGAFYIQCVWKTSPFETDHIKHHALFSDKDTPIFIAFWHGRMAMLPYAWTWDRPFDMLLSQHRDGRLIAQLLTYFKINSIYGSTTRGGSAAGREILSSLQKGRAVGITPDGPKGPRHVCKKGIIQLAHMAAASSWNTKKQCWIIPLGYTISKNRTLKTWDAFMVPKPFAKGRFLTSTPLCITADMASHDLENARLLLEKRLSECL